jgi:hypothetical protein
MIQASSLSYLFFALAVWPVWVPLAVAWVEGPGWRQRTMATLGVLGVLFGALYYLPLVWGGMLDPTVVGHSIHYDFSALPATDLVQQWVWPVLYLGSVAAPLLVSRDHRLRVLGIGAILSAALTFAAFEYAFASVWCFFAAALSGFITFVMIRLPCPTVGIADTNPPLLPTH